MNIHCFAASTGESRSPDRKCRLPKRLAAIAGGNTTGDGVGGGAPSDVQIHTKLFLDIYKSIVEHKEPAVKSAVGLFERGERAPARMIGHEREQFVTLGVRDSWRLHRWLKVPPSGPRTYLAGARVIVDVVDVAVTLGCRRDALVTARAPEFPADATAQR